MDCRVATAPHLYSTMTKGCLEKLSFCPISALFKKIYPRNISYMPAVNFLSRLDLEQKS